MTRSYAGLRPNRRVVRLRHLRHRPGHHAVGKGITSGYAPLSATLLSDRIADVLIERGGEWAHGFTFGPPDVLCGGA